MTDKKKIKKYLQKHLSNKRYEHTLGTVRCASILALRYNIDIEKCKTAALLHDCAKWMDEDTILRNAKEYGIVPDDFYISYPELLHSYAAASIAKKKFEVVDQDILDAICYHTIPVLNMNEVAKIIYIADKIEETRKFRVLKQIRKKKKLKLDQLFYETLKAIIVWHIENDKMVHVDSLTVFNALVSQKM